MDTDLTHFIASAIYLLPLLPSALILFPQWRVNSKQLFCILASAILAHLFLIGLLYVTLGPCPLTTWLWGVVVPVAYVTAFVFLAKVRDSRLFFTIIALGQITAMSDMLTGLFSSAYATPHWIVLKLLISVVLFAPASLLCRKPFHEMLRNGETSWLRMSIVPLLLLISFLSSVTLPFALGNRPIAPFPALMLAASIILFYTTVYHYYCSTFRQTLLKQENAVLRTQMSMMEHQAQSIFSAEQRAKTFRHDIRHFIRLLRGCLVSERPMEMGAILDRMEENLTSSSNLGALHSYTGDPILDTVLTYAAEQADPLGIAFHVQFQIPPDFRADRTEFAVVVFNALENAITATAHEPAGLPRVVRIYTTSCLPQFFLAVSNSFTGTVIFEAGTGLPVASQPGHGYGTRSIAAFAQKYGGMLDCSVDGGEFLLRLLI